MLLIILYLPFLIDPSDIDYKFDENGKPVFPTHEEVCMMRRQFDSVGNAITKRLNDTHGGAYVLKVICVSDHKYFVQKQIDSDVLSVYDNEWAHKFADCDLPIGLFNLYDDPYALFDVIRSYTSSFPNMHGCELSYHFLPWRRFIASEFDDSIIPSHMSLNTLDHNDLTTEYVHMGDRERAEVDSQMTSQLISPSLREWYEAVRYVPATPTSSLLSMMGYDSGLRLSGRLMEHIMACDSAQTFMGSIMDEYLEILSACGLTQFDIESSASLCCLFLASHTLIRNPTYFASL